ncbi:sensor histidine kinase [Aeromonas caviae]|uniref:sensor histidine kinase n=1 Tax=Aeromonas caviae TaxID=648 RepID=UPI0038D18260
MRILERESERKQMLSSPLGLFSILLIILPMVILSIRFGLKRSLRPLTELGVFLQKKNKNDLSKITYGLNYKELNPVINAINEFIELNLERLRKESDFLTDMAHELRTPISAAVVSLHNIKLSMKWLPNLAYEMEILNASLERAVLLSKRVIELSRIGKQGNYDDSSIIHISKLIAYHITENYKEIKKRNLSVSFRGDEDISFKFSREILDCIIGNIISNACRYNKNNGAIDISSRLIYGGIYLSVSDSGCGIPKDQRELIFQRFHRVKNNNEIGSGLGLSIVKETLSLVGGRICVTDNIYHGSTFHVWIPMRQK